MVWILAKRKRGRERDMKERKEGWKEGKREETTFK